ncbi:inner-membrane translocator [Streptomyces coeruleorubidus]|uniref:inner-membrane translocator n=1 Tax=Streptomyces coeruleorubidus TaxID=116188 RepID=UPI00237F9B90|nr:inner-membrane translocator [Streptomyces coeruleorubidus]WDV55394.1 inner-membrane translocator [Streptomyces coeruleorubidus]
MPEHDDKQPSTGNDALTAGCLLLLVLVADAAAGFLVVLLLAARGLGRMDAGSGQTPAAALPADWAPLLSFGALALAVGVTGVLLLRLGHPIIGAVQLVLCIVLAGHALGSWP